MGYTVYNALLASQGKRLFVLRQYAVQCCVRFFKLEIKRGNFRSSSSPEESNRNEERGRTTIPIRSIFMLLTDIQKKICTSFPIISDSTLSPWIRSHDVNLTFKLPKQLAQRDASQTWVGSQAIKTSLLVVLRGAGFGVEEPCTNRPWTFPNRKSNGSSSLVPPRRRRFTAYKRSQISIHLKVRIPCRPPRFKQNDYGSHQDRESLMTEGQRFIAIFTWIFSTASVCLCVCVGIFSSTEVWMAVKVHEVGKQKFEIDSRRFCSKAYCRCITKNVTLSCSSKSWMNELTVELLT